MGMDVIGNDPRSERGAYFRNNIWWWHPLATFVQDFYPEIARGCQHWHTNDGDGLDGDDATRLADAIFADIKSGKVAEYDQNYRRALSELPMEDCDWCGATGIRTDEVGVQMGFPDRELGEAEAVLTGRTRGWCNGCGGVGRKASWDANYPFSEENVKNFAEFLADCGGFAIC